MLHEEPEKVPNFEYIDLDYSGEKFQRIIEQTYEDYEEQIHGFAARYIENLSIDTDDGAIGPGLVAWNIGQTACSQIGEILTTFQDNFNDEQKIIAAKRALGKRAMENGNG